MGKSAVQEILNRIEKLPDSDRAVLEAKLAQRAESQWQREATVAQKLARERASAGSIRRQLIEP